jgi:5-methylcytosine-specific restriction protein A
MANVIGLCPGHHREAHYGANAERLEKEFLRILAKLQKRGTDPVFTPCN